MSATGKTYLAAGLLTLGLTLNRSANALEGDPFGQLPPQTAPRYSPPATAVPIVITDAPPPLFWKWRRFSTTDLIITGVGGALTLTASIVKPRAQHSFLGGAFPFDEDIRDALRPDSLETRYRYRDISDVGLSLSFTWPLIADALTTAWWYRGSREVAQEMALIDLQTMAVIGAIQGVTNVLVSRERPFGRDCGTDELPADAVDCVSSNHYRSFFSGHSAFSFTGASLICVHHFQNQLLGPPWDAISCAGGYVVAAATTSFRVVSDMHYASDVLTGALMGTVIGYGVPLLHYSRPIKAQGQPSLSLTLVPSPGGIGVLGVF